MSTAAALGLALSDLTASDGRFLNAATIVAVTSAGMVVGCLALRVVGRSSVGWGDTAARLLGGAVAPLLTRSVQFGGHPLLWWQAAWGDSRWLVAVTMMLVGSVTMLVSLALEAAVRAGRDHAPLLPAVVDELRSTLGWRSRWSPQAPWSPWRSWPWASSRCRCSSSPCCSPTSRCAGSPPSG